MMQTACEQGSITSGCDTVGQITSLADWLKQFPAPGRVTIVTSQGHIERAMAIAKIVLVNQGWQADGFGVFSGDHRPDQDFQLIRDQIRSYLWRLTGWHAGFDLGCDPQEL